MINTTNTLISMWVALCCTNTHRHTHTRTRTQPARLWAGLVGQCHFRAKQASFRKVKHSRRLWQQKWSPVGLSAWSATLCGLGRWKLQIIVHLFWWKKTRLSLNCQVQNWLHFTFISPLFRWNLTRVLGLKNVLIFSYICLEWRFSIELINSSFFSQTVTNTSLVAPNYVQIKFKTE